MKMTSIEEVKYALMAFRREATEKQLEDGLEVTIETDDGHELFVQHPADQRREHWVRVTIFSNTDLTDEAENIFEELTTMIDLKEMWEMKYQTNGPN